MGLTYGMIRDRSIYGLWWRGVGKVRSFFFFFFFFIKRKKGYPQNPIITINRHKSNADNTLLIMDSP